MSDEIKLDPKRRSPIKKNPLHEQQETPKVNLEKEDENKPSLFIPADHVPVTLGSGGLLGYPKVLTYRDYTLDEILELNSLEDDLQMLAIVNVLNKLNQEGIDHNDVHPNDILQILLALHGSFISNVIERKYYLNMELPEGDEIGQLDHKENIGIVDIPVASIKIRLLGTDENYKPYEKQVKVPFSVQDETTGNTIKFRFLKAKDIVRAIVKAKEKYHDEERQFTYLKRGLEKLQTITNEEKRSKEIEKFLEEKYDEWKEYQVLLQKRNIEEARIITISKIAGVNDIMFDDSDEDFAKKEALQLSASIWDFVDNVVYEKYDFGVVEEVTFFSEHLSKNITRRFSFRYDNFLPTDYAKATRRYSVSFD